MKAKTDTATLPIAENLNRNRPAPETDPPRVSDTNEVLPSTVRDTNPWAAVANQLEGFTASALTQWAYAIRGLVGLILAILYLLKGQADFRNLMGSLGVFALIGGVCMLIAGGKTIVGQRREWLIVIEGIIGVLIGLRLTQLLFVPPVGIGGWMFVTGIFQLVTAVRLRKRTRAWWLLGLSGMVATVSGFFIMPDGFSFRAGAPFDARLKQIEAYMLVTGGLLLFFGLRLRKGKLAVR